MINKYIYIYIYTWLSQPFLAVTSNCNHADGPSRDCFRLPRGAGLTQLVMPFIRSSSKLAPVLPEEASSPEGKGQSDIVSCFVFSRVRPISELAYLTEIV